MDFLFDRGKGGTDINWNHPRRCVWVEIQLPEKFAIYCFQIVWEENLLFSHIGSSPVEIQ